jgi:Spy/CpxP family protein refolding chaperone
MRRQGRQVFVAAGVLAGAGVGYVVLAQAPEGGPERERGRGLEQRLGLTEAQVEQLRGLRVQQAKDAIRRAADLRIARLELRELLEAPEPDEKAIGAKVDAIGGLQTSAVRAKVDRELALRKTLTPEQVKQRREHRRVGRHFRARRHEMREGWERRDGRPYDRGDRGPRADAESGDGSYAAPEAFGADEQGEADAPGAVADAEAAERR